MTTKTSLRMKRRLAGAVLGLALAATFAASPVRAAAPAQFAAAARLQVRWEVAGAASGGNGRPAPAGTMTARLHVTNLDSNPLPAQGWAIYFNCMDEVPKGALPGNLEIEHLGGDLFRLRPTPGFGGLVQGQSLVAAYHPPLGPAKPYKAPWGLYLVYEAAPEAAQAIADVGSLPLPAPEQLAKGPNVPPSVTPQDVYRSNAKADLLPDSALPPVFPTPLQAQPGQGSLRLGGAPAVVAGPGLDNEAGLARRLLRQYWPDGAAPGADPAANRAANPALRLALGKVAGQASPEAYVLQVEAGGIAITGNSAAGVARGLESLRDLLPLPAAGAQAGQVELPLIRIVDAPRYAYRGFQMDVARNFQSKQTVFRVLDLMARFKLNTLHFHLTDDEGWRLEIAGLPELTAIGAVRGHSARPGVRLQPAYGSGPGPDDPHGSGHYSRDDYKEILRYAAARHIEVIPEVDMPGHSRAAVIAMQARYERLKAEGRPDPGRFLLNDFADRSEYYSAQRFSDNVMNPGMESSYAFIEHVVKEVATLHREAGVPLRTFHLGGDELPAGAWEKSPRSRELMARQKLASVADVWDYFFDRVGGILRKQGLRAAGWEEVGARQAGKNGVHKLVPNPRFARRGFTVYAWNNVGDAADLAERLARAGYDTVQVPATRLYFDMSHNQNPDEIGVSWASYIELDAVYDFIPARGSRMRGLESTLFSETVREPADIDYLLMPRLMAMAERAWAADPAWASEGDAARRAALHRAAWSGFVNVLGRRVLPRIDLEQWTGGPVAYRIAPPGLVREGGKVHANHMLPGLALRFTSDGSEPTAASPLVQGAIAERGLIQVAAFDRNGRRGRIARIDNP
jgi:hexosaminidase